VSPEFSAGALVPHRAEHDLHAFPSHEFERRDEVAISRHDRDGTNRVAQSQPRHIQPDSNVHALLTDIEYEIRVS
jgi:hypothetical protein